MEETTTKKKSGRKRATIERLTQKKETVKKELKGRKNRIPQAHESFVGREVTRALGRRKTAIANVQILQNGKGSLLVNKNPLDTYFKTFEQRSIVRSPLQISGIEEALDIHIRVQGGGLRAQADAARLGIARALIVINPVLRKSLKKLGYLSRDPRAKERKKFGLKRARRSPQWSKR